MKKLIISVISALALTAPSVGAMRGEEVRINVVVKGQTIEFEDQQPIIIGGRTLLPVRGVMEALGAEVDWNDAEKCASITGGDVTVTLTIGRNVMQKTTAEGSEDVILDTSPMIFNGRTCLPVRAVAEAFGAVVQWDGDTRTVTIY